MDDANASKVRLPLFPGDAPAAAPPTREQRRSRRHREVRAHTVNMRRLPKHVLELGRLLYPEDESDRARPRTRAECAGVERPCPFVSCAHHLYLDVSPKTGALKLNFPDLEPDELVESCMLDVADRGGETLEDVGRALNITRERVRQIEVKAKRKLDSAIRADRRARETLLEEMETAVVGREDGGPARVEARESIADEFDVETFLALDDVAP